MFLDDQSKCDFRGYNCVEFSAFWNILHIPEVGMVHARAVSREWPGVALATPVI